MTHFVLVPGHWLGAWAWDDVVDRLEALGHRATAITLPGLEPEHADRGAVTLGEQADAIAAALGGPDTVLVVHSGANFPSSVLLDRDPRAVARIVYVDSGPVADGAAFDATVPVDAIEVPLPPFEDLLASLDGLSDADLARFRERAVPEPGGVMREVVALTNDARRDVPATIIASSYPSEVMMRMAREDHPMMAETATLRDLETVDVPTGHWPMWSRPDDLAGSIAATG